MRYKEEQGISVLIHEILNRHTRQDERSGGVKIFKMSYKLRTFTDDLVLVLEDPQGD